MSESAQSLAFAIPLSRERVSDVIAAQLEQAIRANELEPGDRLPTEQNLASEFGVGRTSVREALQKLRALGLVETRKGLGNFVRHSQAGDQLAEFVNWTAGDPASIAQLLEARIALEVLAAALAAVRATDAERAEIQRLAAAPPPATDSPNVDALVAWDTKFHMAILAAGRNPVVSRLHEVLIAELTDFRRRTLTLPWAGSRSAQDHAAIAAAIFRRDVAGARVMMADHLRTLYFEILNTAISDSGRQLTPAPREALV
ncbi:MAG: FCD domain-containing protein [Actinomycetota bacterium]|nr:FCD domain-containing protein [Actinomycetota bacterium]